MTPNEARRNTRATAELQGLSGDCRVRSRAAQRLRIGDSPIQTTQPRDAQRHFTDFAQFALITLQCLLYYRTPTTLRKNTQVVFKIFKTLTLSEQGAQPLLTQYCLCLSFTCFLEEPLLLKL